MLRGDRLQTGRLRAHRARVKNLSESLGVEESQELRQYVRRERRGGLQPRDALEEMGHHGEQ